MQITHLILAWGDDFVFLQAQTYEFMTKLSVNINKIATLRNARGGNVPDVLQAARAIESFGAQGVTVHPRPDERHIRYSDTGMRIDFCLTSETLTQRVIGASIERDERKGEGPSDHVPVVLELSD